MINPYVNQQNNPYAGIVQGWGGLQRGNLFGRNANTPPPVPSAPLSLPDGITRTVTGSVANTGTGKNKTSAEWNDNLRRIYLEYANQFIPGVGRPQAPMLASQQTMLGPGGALAGLQPRGLQQIPPLQMGALAAPQWQPQREETLNG